jgi:hypothetical protein
VPKLWNKTCLLSEKPKNETIYSYDPINFEIKVKNRTISFYKPSNNLAHPTNKNYYTHRQKKHDDTVLIPNITRR